ncbi:ROK family protein [Corynebacterium pseudotuberculosis]|uniref:ROK family protein n=1 Tax=Corynebacterium pseudotuberculosis TaxID=1719 RepID=UPI0002EED541|nr:ROK family protein [Corynebacterium pseudotuberculosis]AFM08347.2 ROK family protein [Corynebacterium pseudotuberculosis Cp162]APG82752.1 N-acetylglucosamine kinase [Corynebacterium pseudotuberculosis]WFP67156.1 ROK family protein [Corynebacterium pseudotuberculosis]
MIGAGNKVQTPVRIGVDIGGTKIAAGLVADANPTTVIEYRRRPTPASNVIQEVAGVIQELIDVSPTAVSSIGIGAPGVIDPIEGNVVSSGPTMQGWAGTKIADTLREQFPVPVAVHNDVRVMGLGESIYGAGQDFNNILFVSLGTGVGGALVRDGGLVASPHCTAGELRCLWGRLPDGSAALLESFASGPGLAASYNAHAENPAVDLHEIMTRYHAGEEYARGVIEEHLFACGVAIGGFISAIDVDAVVVGGGVGNIGDAIINPFARGLKEGAIPPLDAVPVIQAQLGTDAPIVGAAYLGKTQDQINKVSI